MAHALNRFMLAVAALGLVALVGVGCGGGDSGGTRADTLGDGIGLPDGGIPDGGYPKPGEVVIETQVSSWSVQPEEAVEVTCVLRPEEWENLPTHVLLTEGDEDEVSIDDHTVTFHAPGVYFLACGITGTALTDETPTQVTVSEGGPAVVETAVAPNPATAGEDVEVTCSAFDGAGNVAEAHFEIDVTPDEGWELDGTTLTVTVAGSYEVACRAVEGAVDDSPEMLVVEPGALSDVTTTLADDSIVAGGTTTVSCQGTDAYGNAIEGLSFTLEAAEELDVSGSDVSSTVAGLHAIGCRLADADPAVVFHDAELQVSAGAAVTLVLEPVPDKEFYKIRNSVTIEHSAFDEYGNQVPDLAITPVQVSPEEGLERLDDAEFRFTAEGVFTFSASLVDAPTVTAQIELACDGQGPAVVIDYPPRGATITGERTVTVVGSVVDPVAGVQSFSINGDDVELGEDGSFSYPMGAVHGLNIIATEAKDEANQTEASWRAFYFSDHYYPMDMADPVGSHVSHGVAAFIGADTLDSSDPNMVDVAGIMENIIDGIDLNGLIPNPAGTQSVGWCNYDIYVRNISMGRPVVSLTPFAGTPGGMHLWAEIPSFSAEAEASADEFACVDATADVSARYIRIQADLQLEIYEDGSYVANVVLNDLRFIKNDAGDEGINVDVQGVLGFFTNWIINFFEDDIANLIEDQFRTTLEDEVGGMLDELLSFLALDEVFEIPPFIGDNTTVLLNLNTAIQRLYFTDTGAVAYLAGAVLADKLVSREPLGSIGRGSCNGGESETYALPQSNPIEAGAHDDVLNQALYSFWAQGGMNLVITAEDLAEMGADLSSMGIADLAVTTRLLLPPIIEGCTDDGMLLLQVGDAYVEASFGFLGQPVELGMYLQLAFQAELALVEGEAGPEIGILLPESFDLFEVEVVSINEEQAGREDTYANLFRGLPDILLGELGADPISFAIPSFDIGGLIEGMPEGQWVTVLPAELGRGLGYTFFYGQLAPGTPPAPEEPPAR